MVWIFEQWTRKQNFNKLDMCDTINLGDKRLNIYI